MFRDFERAFDDPSWGEDSWAKQDNLLHSGKQSQGLLTHDKSGSGTPSSQALTTQQSGGGQLIQGQHMFRPMSCKVDVIEEKDKYIVNAELPGLNKKEIDIQVHDGVLTLRGEHKTERKEENKDKNYIRMERSYGSFQRSLQLPQDSDVSKISANYVDGILKVNIPRSAELAKKETKIPIA